MNIERLRDLREDKDLLQKDVAKVLKITQNQYWRYETGIRLIPVDKLDKLAEFYDTTIDYLVGRTDERRPLPKSILSPKNKSEKN